MIKTKLLSGIFIALSLALASGCNPDAFVRHLNPSAKEFAVSEDGDSLKVRFGNKDWHVSEIIVDGKSLGWLARGEGVATGKDGRVQVSKERFTMFYKHSGKDELTLYFLPNFSNEKIDVQIIVSDPFEQESLNFTQSRGAEYELERMEWGTPSKGTLEYQVAGWTILNVKNDTPDTVSIKMRPLMGASRRVTFSDESAFADWRTDFKVPIPDTVLDGDKLTFGTGTNVTYSHDSFEYPLNNQTVIKVKVPPLGESTRDYGVLWDVESYTVDYVMFLKNTSTGNVIDIKGTLTNRSPNGVYTIFYDQK